MPSYVVHVHVESAIEDETEDLVTTTMAKFGFGKGFKTDDGTVVGLAPWLYEGVSGDDEQTVAGRLRTMLYLAIGKELVVLVLQAEHSHFAHTQGSLAGIADIDPDGY